MALRGGDLYLSWPVRHALRLLAQSTSGKKPSDAIAEEVLLQWLMTEHADLWQFVQDQQQREDAMVQQLAGTAPAPAKRSKGAA